MLDGYCDTFVLGHVLEECVLEHIRVEFGGERLLLLCVSERAYLAPRCSP